MGRFAPRFRRGTKGPRQLCRQPGNADQSAQPSQHTGPVRCTASVRRATCGRRRRTHQVTQPGHTPGARPPRRSGQRSHQHRGAAHGQVKPFTRPHSDGHVLIGHRMIGAITDTGDPHHPQPATRCHGCPRRSLTMSRDAGLNDCAAATGTGITGACGTQFASTLVLAHRLLGLDFVSIDTP
jgi:hypothetical protein